MNRLEQGVCVKCGMPLVIERTDSIPLHGECEKEIRTQAMRPGKKHLLKSPVLTQRGMRYVPPGR
jgi:hypothetical protein